MELSHPRLEFVGDRFWLSGFESHSSQLPYVCHATIKVVSLIQSSQFGEYAAPIIDQLEAIRSLKEDTGDLEVSDAAGEMLAELESHFAQSSGNSFIDLLGHSSQAVRRWAVEAISIRGASFVKTDEHATAIAMHIRSALAVGLV